MSYSNDQTQIKMGLVNFIGALLKSSPFKDKAARQNVASILSEETLKLAQDEDKIVDLYVAKPMFKGVMFICNQRASELSKLPKNPQVQEQILKYKNIVESLENLISMV